jgi:hypothetical protein
MVLEPSLRPVLPLLMSDTTSKIPARPGLLDRLLVSDHIPDALIRLGIRRLLRQRLAEEDRGDVEANRARLMELVAELRRSPIAIETAAANAQRDAVILLTQERPRDSHVRLLAHFDRSVVSDETYWVGEVMPLR